MSVECTDIFLLKLYCHFVNCHYTKSFIISKSENIRELELTLPYSAQTQILGLWCMVK